MRTLRIIYAAVSWAMLAGAAVQVFLAGFALFGGSDFELHAGFGYLLGLIVLPQIIAALAARAYEPAARIDRVRQAARWHSGNRRVAPGQRNADLFPGRICRMAFVGVGGPG